MPLDVADLIAIIDLHGFEDSEEDDKVSVLNDTLQEVCTREPWPFLETFADIDASTDVDADGLVDLGMSAPALASVLDIINTANNGRTVHWTRRDEHFKAQAANLSQTGDPYKYYFVGNDLYLWPIPTSGTFRITYLQVQGDIDADMDDTDILLPARHLRLLAIGAIAKLHAQEDDPENAALFESQFEKKLQLMRQDVYKKQWDRPDSIQVTDEDDWGYES